MATPWITTYSGKRFFPLSPRAADVNIGDIAHSLSMTCRFRGHTIRFYSVAEHSERCSWLVDGALAKTCALLHDAAEAYLVDMPSPMKPHFAEWPEIEGRIQKAVLERFGLLSKWDRVKDVVKEADRQMLLVEARDLLVTRPIWGASSDYVGVEPIAKVHDQLTAKMRFLRDFERWNVPALHV